MTPQSLMGESWRGSDRSLSRRAAYGHPADDFRDVFGGPPRSVLLRRFSGADLPAARPAVSTRDESGKLLAPARRVQVRTAPGFYDDIFGSDGGAWRSKSRASASVLGTVDVSAPPLSCAPVAAEDAVLSAVSFSYKLRPIDIPPRNQKSPSPSSTKSKEARSTSSSTSLIGFKHLSGHEKGTSGDMLGLACCGFSSSPDTFSLESSFWGSQAKPLPWEYSELEEESTTSSSVTSPVLLVGAERSGPRCASVMREAEGEEDEEEDAEGSFVMEFHDAGLDESMTWAAKDKLWSQF